MPSYRYYTADLLTGNVLGELDLFGVYATKMLSRAGQFTGSMKLTGNTFDDALRLSCSIPGRTALYLERDDDLVWGGILWNRMWSTQGKSLQLNGQTFESYFDRVVLEQHFIQQGVAQEQIFNNLVNQLQAQENCDIGLDIVSLPTTNRNRTVLIPDYEYHFATDALQQVVGVDEGLEYTIDPTDSATVDHPVKLVRVGYPELGAANPDLVFDFPGGVRDYWTPESGTTGGVKFAALGFGSGNKVARATAVVQELLDDGWPAWWIVKSYPTIADLGIMQDKVTNDAIKHRIPNISPTFDLDPEHSNFNGWNKLGDTFKVNIEDYRFPSGHTITSRMIGWELTPQSSDSPELIKLVIEGADL
jgi:hypothetical protein